MNTRTKMNTRTFNWHALAKTFYLFIAILYAVVLPACAQRGGEPASATNAPPSTQPDARATPPPPESPTPAEPVVAPASSPPPPQEVEAALVRVYQTAVAADERGLASALTGDFNGDNSQDIAIVVKPDKAQLSEINSEFSNWILEDPRHVRAPAQVSRADPPTPAPARAQVEAGDTLLAIIHGYKAEGWRNASAKQTYLLKNANGSQMRMQTVREARQRIREAAAAHQLSSVRGDLICEVLDGKPGCLYWTGAKYGWFDETSFRQTAK